MSKRTVLNVGGNSKQISLPPIYEGWKHVLLDIDPKGEPDVLCDARELSALAGVEYDAVYCSHNLEHYFRHDVSKVLAGFRHILKTDGFAHVLVPDIGELMRIVVARGLDIDDFLYQSPAGPITVRDVLYGYGVEIERSGSDFFAHKTGFTAQSLRTALHGAGFATVYTGSLNMEAVGYAFIGPPSDEAIALLNLPPIAPASKPA